MNFRNLILTYFRRRWRATINDKGGICPVCDRWGKVYPRSINKTMAASLAWLCTQKGWTDVPADAPREVVKSNQLPTLRWWGLVKRLQSDTERKKHSGVWRATLRGRQFNAGEIDIEATVVTYNGEVIARSEKTVNISDIDTEFDYSEVMEAAHVE